MNQERKAFMDGLLSLDPFDKLDIYMHYFIGCSALANDFHIDSDGGKCEMKYYWKRSGAMPIEDFFDPKRNYFEIDHGDDWEKSGWAERNTLVETGAFRYVKVFNPKGIMSKIQRINEMGHRGRSVVQQIQDFGEPTLYKGGLTEEALFGIIEDLSSRKSKQNE